MFNFNNHEVVTSNKKVQKADVKVYAQNKVRFSDNALSRIGLVGEMKVIVSKDKESGMIAIYATARTGEGRKLTKDNGTTHEETALALGGRGAEWAVTGDGQINPVTNEKWFQLTQTAEAKVEEPTVETESTHVEEVVTTEEVPNLTAAQGGDRMITFD